MKHSSSPSRKRGKRSKAFSVVLAVKGNARTQVGQPRPARVLSEKSVERQQSKHKPTFAQQLSSDDGL